MEPWRSPHCGFTITITVLVMAACCVVACNTLLLLLSLSCSRVQRQSERSAGQSPAILSEYTVWTKTTVRRIFRSDFQKYEWRLVVTKCCNFHVCIRSYQCVLYILIHQLTEHTRCNRTTLYTVCTLRYHNNDCRSGHQSNQIPRRGIRQSKVIWNLSLSTLRSGW